MPASPNSLPVIAADGETVFAMVAYRWAVAGRIHPNVRTRGHPQTRRSDADAAQVSVSLHSSSTEKRGHRHEHSAGRPEGHYEALETMGRTGERRVCARRRETLGLECRDDCAHTIEFTIDRPHRASLRKPALILTLYRWMEEISSAHSSARSSTFSWPNAGLCGDVQAGQHAESVRALCQTVAC